MSMVLLIILALILPPLAVFMKGGCSLHFFLNMTLYALGVIFAVAFDFPIGGLATIGHAIWVVVQVDE